MRSHWHFLCRDAKYMARDVHGILRDLVQSRGKMTQDDAEKYIQDLQTKGRYAQDVWSWGHALT